MNRPAEQDTESPRSSVDTVLDILEAFDENHRAIGVRELARRSGVPRSTVHRVVHQLRRRGALEADDQGRLQIGVRLFEVGTLAPVQTRIRDAALPFAHHLSEFTRLTVNIAVRESNEVVYLEKISIANLRVPHTRMGGRASLHATGLGKAILAFCPAEMIDAVLTGPLRLVTPLTITDPDVLRRELATIRSRRVAFDLQESHLGLFCVAAPILDAMGAPMAAISVTGATERAQVDEHASAVRTAALAIGRAMQASRR